MADKINGLGRPPVDVSQSRNRAVGEASEGSRGKATDRTGAGADAVSVSSTASHLQRVEASLAVTPEVDAARVEEIRQQIASGTYRINAENLADRLIRFELGLF